MTLTSRGFPSWRRVSRPPWEASPVARALGPNLWDELSEEDRVNIADAAKAIYANYQTGLKAVGKA
jgi:hypothetical protein